MKYLISIVVVFILVGNCIGQKPENLIHNQRLYVDDYADVFSDQQETELDGIIRKFFDTTQISIVTVKSFDGIEPSEYTLRLGRTWGVGGKSNNGLILVIGVNDHKMYAATGQGIQGDLPDYLVVDYQHEYAVPKFKENKYFEGTRDLLNAYINQLSPSAKAIREKEKQVQKELAAQRWEKTKGVLLTILFIIGIACLIGLPFYIKWRKRVKARREEEERLEEERQRKYRESYVQPIFTPSYYPSSMASSNDYSSGSGYSSGSDYSSSSSSSDSSSSNNSSSDFGGGSYDGGGGGSSW